MCPEDVLRTFPKDVLWTSPCGSLCNAKRRSLPTSTGRWNMTSWERPHIFLYVTSREVLQQRLEDASCRRYEDVSKWFNMYFQGTCPTDVVKVFLYSSITKAKKRPRDKDFLFGLSINECYIIKISSTAKQVDDTKGGDTCLKLNNKTYIFLSSEILSSSILSFINLINFFHQYYLILLENWLYIMRKNLCHQQWQ